MHANLQSELQRESYQMQLTKLPKMELYRLYVWMYICIIHYQLKLEVKDQN